MGHLLPAGTGLPAYRRLRIDTLGADMEKLSPEEAAKHVEGVAIPTPEVDLNKVPGLSEASENAEGEAPAAEGAPAESEDVG